jgi:hypothetical protein
MSPLITQKNIPKYSRNFYIFLRLKSRFSIRCHGKFLGGTKLQTILAGTVFTSKIIHAISNFVAMKV